MFKGFAIPRVHGRGAGLGNEMLVWAKARIAAEVLSLHCLPPAFGLNSRGYSKYFRTPPLDWAIHASLRTVLPHFEVTEADHLAAGAQDFTTTIEQFATRHDLSSKRGYTLSVDGMWGGFLAIEPAKEFIRSKLLASRWALGNLFATQQRLRAGKLTVGFHIRRGDFAPPTDDDAYRARFNVALPLDWYVNIARDIRQKLGTDVNFLVVSDAPSAELAPFGTEIECVFTDDQPNRDISDLLALSLCDLIVCSISSYSLWAAFLSPGRYIWPAANLTDINGFASIWGHEVGQSDATSPTMRAMATLRSMPEEMGRSKGLSVEWNGILPYHLVEDLNRRQQTLRRETDLLFYGVVSA